jgi:hypothetical protein
MVKLYQNYALESISQIAFHGLKTLTSTVANGQTKTNLDAHERISLPGHQNKIHRRK